jgi:hypothetical protein
MTSQLISNTQQIYTCNLVLTDRSKTLPVNDLHAPDRILDPVVVTIVAQTGHFIFQVNHALATLLDSPTADSLKLTMPNDLMAELRRSALLDELGRAQSGITFCTRYSDSNQDLSQQGHDRYPPATHQSASQPIDQLVLRTVVSLDGDIINQVDRVFLDHPACLRVTIAHNHLIAKAMACLRSNTAAFLSIILQISPVLVIGATVATNARDLFSEARHDLFASLQWVATSCLSLALPMLRRQIIATIKSWLWRCLMVPTTPIGRVAHWTIGRFMP